MTWETHEENRANRAAQEAAAAEKGKRVLKRVSKRKSPSKKVAAGTDRRVAQPRNAPAPWKAPVARMVVGGWS